MTNATLLRKSYFDFEDLTQVAQAYIVLIGEIKKLIRNYYCEWDKLIIFIVNSIYLIIYMQSGQFAYKRLI